ncbi:alpha/beta fold hydrolase [Arthrobacter sp. MSA 4-2]|uniref:alpha/beta fold hydrolase n=1 Tax=Arthrobacter sp. MSA 4-2 TaxID=2794349 RepID=UPI0018E7EDF7|nr:alpha/beta fold hydrolase [Arthrobacter sp. MSA 4-2]MBJ2121344.1 alpha/beta fold hydrolase [Arthrobacter sp. MSA 4-2]
MKFLESNHADGILERPFRLGALPGVVWTRNQPGQRTALVLLAHGGGQHKGAPAVAARARRYLKELDAAIVAIDAPGHGDREWDGRDTLFIDQLTQARRDGTPVGNLIEGYNADVATQALPELSEVLTAVQALDEIGPDVRIGFWGLSLGSAIGIPFVAGEPRVTAAVLGLAGSDQLREQARRIRVPVQFLLQWDDEFVDRAVGLGVYDALASTEKSLHANAGGHTAVPRFEIEAEARFFARHLAVSA